MCIKAGENELESVKNLMGMSLKAVVAEALQVELEGVTEEVRLTQDLRMDHEGAKALHELIADVFDGIDVDVERVGTFAELLDTVVLSEFRDVEGGQELHHDAAA